MRVVYVLIGFIVFLFLYSIVVTDVPFGLEKTPSTHNEITLQEVTRL